MLYELYVIYDRKSGLYSVPFADINDSTATRTFGQMCAQNPSRDDLELYKVGGFDTSRGLYTAVFEKPDFVVSYASMQEA